MGFDGFTAATSTFFAGLAANNNRNWFEAHRADYDAHVMARAKTFVAELAPALADIDARLVAEPRLNGSIRRLNRDVRFSKDKTPYTPHLHLIFWAGDHPLRSPGHHLVIGGERVGFGAGHWGFDKQGLERYRAAVTAPGGADQLMSILGNVEAAGVGRLDEPALKRVPAGYDADGPAAALLRHKGLVVREDVIGGSELFSAGAVAFTAGLVKKAHPLLAWLLANVYD